MKLERFYAVVGPFLEGKAGLGETQRALYGGATSIDAQRLPIYARLVKGHRLEAAGAVFPTVRTVVERVGGDPAWEALAEAYFAAHPMRHVELNENAGRLAEFLGHGEQVDAGYAVRAGLPRWLGALADFEWWEWQTRIALGSPEDDAPRDGPLRLASTVELRPYDWALVQWMDADEAQRPEGPAPGQTLVLFWRNAALAERRANADPVELAVLKAVVEGQGLGAPAGVAADRWTSTVEDLREAGIVLGVPRGGPR